jgi:hypothetical protein
LNSFAEAHIVSQYAADSAFIETDKPIQPN